MRTHGGGGITIESISLSGSFAVCRGKFIFLSEKTWTGHWHIPGKQPDLFSEPPLPGNAGRHKNIIRELGLHVLSLQSSKLQKSWDLCTNNAQKVVRRFSFPRLKSPPLERREIKCIRKLYKKYWTRCNFFSVKREDWLHTGNGAPRPFRYNSPLRTSRKEHFICLSVSVCSIPPHPWKGHF